ncbi:MAG: hypothetical protein FRX49_09068, partial [Trebouxia sp. A1-2]
WTKSSFIPEFQFFASYPVIQEAGTEDLSGEDKEQWQDGLQQLKGLGMADDEAEKSLKRGFGWSSQAYWWKDKVREVPKPGEVACMLLKSSLTKQSFQQQV